MRLAIEGTHLDHARLRECSYCLFAVMARVFGEEFNIYLDTIVPQLLKSCQLEEFDPFILDGIYFSFILLIVISVYELILKNFYLKCT